MNRRVEIVPYQAKWSTIFEQEIEQLKKVFGENLVWAEHIGSTAIPNLYARPIIDILIAVRHLGNLEHEMPALRALGYELKPDGHRSGSQWLIKGGKKYCPCYLVLFQMGNAELAHPINLKRFLIDHPKTVQKYNAIKLQSKDLEKYTLLKNRFIASLQPCIKIYTIRRPIETERLKLRPLVIQDAPTVRDIIMQSRDIAENNIAIPYPYDISVAENWIRGHRRRCRQWEEAIYGICLKETSELIGAIGFTINSLHQTGEIGYWLSKTYWNKGYTTEAANRLLEFGFIQLGLNRIFGISYSLNVNSNRVMLKIGMQQEGHFRQYYKNPKRGNHFEDVDQFAVLATDPWGKK